VSSGQKRLIADRYEVHIIGGGGMATVWQGYDTVLDRLVAIKQVRPEQHHSPQRRRELADRFRREARVTAKIEHPGVPAVYDAAIDVDTSDVEQLYLVMQLVRGHTVADLCAARGPLPVDWAVSIAAQVCVVLSYAHAIPVVHRDLKPSNLMVDGNGNVKVLDFGIAAVLGTDVTQLTQSGQILGTHDYMSPEQSRGVGVSPRSDLYALGCVLHEMLAGSKVFDGSTDHPVVQHTTDPPPALRTLRGEVDERIERLVLELLAKAPDDRPASAQEVFDRLAPFLPAPGSAATAPAGVQANDPTRPYRQPLAPLRPAATPPPARSPIPAPRDEHRTVSGRLIAALAAAERQAEALIEEQSFTLAADVLRETLDSPDAQGAAGHPRVLDTRSMYAAALFLGGDFGRALRVLDDLAAAYTRLVGDRDQRVVDCRRQAAYCQVELGDTEAALAQFRHLLAGIPDDRDDDALELRLQIGILLLATNRLPDAARLLRPLQQDLIAARGPDDADAQQVRDLLARIRLTGGTRH
jgi:serine/threonine protein kinase